MFPGNRCYKIWLLCTWDRNHPKKYICSKVTYRHSPTLLKIKTSSRGLHCVKNAEILVFSDLYYPVYGHNRIHFSCIWTDSLILSKYGKIRIWFCSCTVKYWSEKACNSIYLTHCFPVLNFYNGLTWKNNPFRGIEKFQQPPAITILQLLHFFVG